MATKSKTSTSKTSTSSKTSSSSSSKASTTSTTKTSSNGYSETTTKNKDGSTTVTASRPQDGTTGTVKSSDGSSTSYNGKGGYSTTDSSGKVTGGGNVGTESWTPTSSSGGGSSSRDTSVAALSGDVNAISSIQNQGMSNLNQANSNYYDAFNSIAGNSQNAQANTGWESLYGSAIGNLNSYQDTPITYQKEVPFDITTSDGKSYSNAEFASLSPSDQVKLINNTGTKIMNNGKQVSITEAVNLIGQNKVTTNSITGLTPQEQDLLDRMNMPQGPLGLSDEDAQKKQAEYLASARAQLQPYIDNYTNYLNTLKGQQVTDNKNIDTTYNLNANDMFANQFQQANQMNQQMTERGLSNSGLSADALARLQMAGNTDLQKAFLSTQGQKADLGRQYNDQYFDINTKLADLSPEAQAAKMMDAYKTAYLESQQESQASNQKSLQELFKTLTDTTTARRSNYGDNFTKSGLGQLDSIGNQMNNARDNSVKLGMNQLDNLTSSNNNYMNNSTSLANNQLDNQTILDKANIDSYTSIVNNQTDNQTVIDKAKLDSYTTLTKTQMENEVQIAIESGKLVLAQDIARTQATGTVYIGGKQLLVKGKPIPTLDFMKLSEENRHNIATENNVKNGDYLDYAAAMDGNNAKREGDQLDFTQGMDANEVKRQKIAADVGIATKKIELGYANLEKDYFVAQGNIDKAAASLAMTARNAGNAEAQTAIKIIQSKIDTLKAQIGKGKPNKEQKKALEGLLGELDAVGKQIAATPITSESGGTDINSLIP